MKKISTVQGLNTMYFELILNTNIHADNIIQAPRYRKKNCLDRHIKKSTLQNFQTFIFTNQGRQCNHLKGI